MGLGLWGADVQSRDALGFSDRNWQKAEWFGEVHGLCNPSLQIHVLITPLLSEYLSHTLTTQAGDADFRPDASVPRSPTHGG